MNLEANELRGGVIFEKDGNLYRVEKFRHRMHSRGQAHITVKARALDTGKLREFKFGSNEKVKEGDVARKTLEFLYHDERKGELVFLEKESKDRLELAEDILAEGKRGFLKNGLEVTAYVRSDTGKVVRVELPLKIDLKVKRAGPTDRGDSTGSVTKPVVLETGAKVQTPMFIENGDVVKVNTETGEYVERVSQL